MPDRARRLNAVPPYLFGEIARLDVFSSGSFVPKRDEGKPPLLQGYRFLDGRTSDNPPVIGVSDVAILTLNIGRPKLRLAR